MEPPILPAFDIPIEAFIPVPAIELPTADQLEFEPIFLPQKVLPGSVQQLVEPEEDSDAQQKPPAEETEPPVEPQTVDRTLQQVQQYLRLNPRLDMQDGWPFYEEPVEPILPEEPKEEAIEGVVTIQVLGIGVPMPAPEILVAAGATAGVSVAATLASTAMLKRVTGIMKPIIKQAIAQLQKKKVVKLSWARERLVQRRHKRLHTDSQA